MRIFKLFTVLVSANVLAGFMAGFLAQQANLVWTSTGVLAATLVAGCTLLWLRNRTQTFGSQFSAFANDVSADNQPATGIEELDQLAAQFLHSFNQNALREQAIARDQEDPEVEELRRFLAELDRREVERENSDQQPSLVSQLNEILRGYGNEFESIIQQAIACAREIERSTEQIVMGADDQSDTVNRTSRHIESLSSEILASGESADFAADSSAKAQASASSGLQEFEKIVSSLETMRNQVATRERKLQVLGQHSREIGTFVESIGKLSSRTDLLALNASIESVRAGEQGRGFALVAEEVRALSEQSAQAVLDISSRIELIQLETQESIAVASGEHDQIQRLIQRLSEALSEMKNVGDASNDCASNVAELSDASQNQLKFLKQIVDELGNSSNVAKGNRIQAEGVHWTAKTLQQIGEQLNQSVKAFKHVEKQAASNTLPQPTEVQPGEADAVTV